jgi:hypothetical protein
MSGGWSHCPQPQWASFFKDIWEQKLPAMSCYLLSQLCPVTAPSGSLLFGCFSVSPIPDLEFYALIRHLTSHTPIVSHLGKKDIQEKMKDK